MPHKSRSLSYTSSFRHRFIAGVNKYVCARVYAGYVSSLVHDALTDASG